MTDVPRGYKQTEVGVMPEDWDDPQLAEMVKDDSPICYGIVQVGSFARNGIPVLAIKNLNSDYATNIHRASVEIERPYARSRIRPDDVVISVKGSTGRVGIVPTGFHGNISRDLARLRLREGIVPKFCFQMLQSDLAQRRLSVAVVGTTRMELSIAILKQVRIPLPPTKAEQETIAEALSDADALIESLEQLLAKKRHIKQGAMQELLTGKKRLPGFNNAWQVKRLRDVVITIPGGIYGVENRIDGLDPMPVATTAHISDDDQWNGKVMQVRYFTKNQIAAYTVKEGDLVVVKSSGSAASIKSGKIGLVGENEAGAFVFSNFLMVLRPIAVVPKFLYFYQTSYNVKKLLPSLVEASTYPNIRRNEYLAIEIPLPPEEEQTAIAAILSDMDAEIDALETRLAKARQIKQGMMQELLTGKTRLI